jgi:nucleotide-binding universal stress UspA family protein
MYKHILVPTDGSAVSGHAERAAVKLANTLGARITAVHVMSPFSRGLGVLRTAGSMGAQPYSETGFREAAARRGRAALRRVVERAQAAGVAADVQLMTDASPAESLLRTANQLGCDLIVMASNGRRRIERLFLGSVAAEVLRDTRAPVSLCR